MQKINARQHQQRAREGSGDITVPASAMSVPVGAGIGGGAAALQGGFDASVASAATAAAASASATEGVLEKLITSSNQLWASLDAENAAKDANPEVLDTLISNLNKVKQMMRSAAKTDL